MYLDLGKAMSGNIESLKIALSKKLSAIKNSNKLTSKRVSK
jgi:hypothetical protein